MINRKTKLLKLMNFWPPLLGAGIHVDFMSKDFLRVDVSMKLRFWNRNYVNTHYGGSLYSMTDPFYMLMLMQVLGREYIVWDKAASIRFKKPGTGRVHAIFELLPEQIEKIKMDVLSQNKVEPVFTIEVRDETGDVVALVEKVLYIKLKAIK
ncbi:MAG: DUF4442 domain-containing protein [Bacteriovorax sp.]|nr:DUF4442 domain-containing protein [Bacteriovorax sp.]